MLSRRGALCATRLVSEISRVTHAEGVQGIPRTPLGCAAWRKPHQGLRSFHSLNPWLSFLRTFGMLMSREFGNALSRLYAPAFFGDPNMGRIHFSIPLV
jgi:hypothetical protein